ncbi:MAG: hypothetical protein JEY99_12880 [Spirochaetales bacterium]|nr:hypothetical protein [Spirochaetales bacterium]
MRRFFHLFIDGLGLGEDRKENPVRDLFSAFMEGMPLVKQVSASGEELPRPFKGGVLIPTDPIMGIPGIPQSATGQTSLFTGINAQAELGFHLTAFPNEKLVRIIEERSLLKVLNEAGVGVTSANMYTKEFLTLRGARRRNMFPVSTLSIMASGIPFRYPEEYHLKMAVFADITNEMIRQRGYYVPLISPDEGGQRVINILKEVPAVFFEYFMTDVLGHRREWEKLRHRADDLNQFVGSILEKSADWDDFTLLITSDHGNCEDLSSADHSLNRIPTIIFSNQPEVLRYASRTIHTLTDVYDFVLSLLVDRIGLKN